MEGSSTKPSLFNYSFWNISNKYSKIINYLLPPILILPAGLTVIVWVFGPELIGIATICLAPVFGFVWIAWILMVCGPEPDAPKIGNNIRISQMTWYK